MLPKVEGLNPLILNTLDFGTLFYVINATIPLILVFSALLMLLLAVPSTPELDNYRASRKSMAYAYLIFGVLSGINAVMNGAETSESDMFIVAAITLIVSSFQSFLFTYALITLINSAFFSKRWLVAQLIPISGFSVSLFCLLFLTAPLLLKITFYLFFAFYLYQLIYYTYIFIREYKRYRIAAGNYFSGEEAKHLNWVRVVFFSALTVGILALALILYPDPVFDLFIAILCGLFYAYFLVKYINYPHLFRKIIIPNEEVLDNADAEADRIQNNLSQLIEQWMKCKSYTEPNITIVSLSNVLNTNRTYLSAYINNNMQMNFNTWINFLRIEEAKEILKSERNLSISDVASMLGYSDHSSFSRQFKKITGYSPVRWRNNN